MTSDDKQRGFIPVFHPLLIGNERRYVDQCLTEGWISSNGRFIGQFESQFAAFCEVEHAIACSNGTTALHLALLAIGVGPGDEVIVPALTYVACANAVLYCGATPVFVDVLYESMNVNPSLLENAITHRTKAVIVVHLYGHPAEMDAIAQIAKNSKILVVEDAAEAHGAMFGGKKVGSFGDIAVFSFFGNKIMTTGEGGMITTNREDLAALTKLLRNQGMDPNRRYWFPVVGYNYRMTNIQAALGVAQLEYIEEHLKRRRTVAMWYDQHLSSLQEMLVLPTEAPGVLHAYWAYTVQLRAGSPTTRDQLAMVLLQAGIETRPTFVSLPTLPVYQHCPAVVPVAERISAGGLNLPCHGLLTEADIIYVAEVLKAGLLPYRSRQ